MDIFYRQLTTVNYDEYRSVRLDCLKKYPGNFGTTYNEELNSKTLKLTDAIKNADQCNFVFGAFNANKNLLAFVAFWAKHV